MLLAKVFAGIMVLQMHLSASDASACVDASGSCDDETSLLQVKQNIQPGVKRAEPEQLLSSDLPVRIGPAQAVFEVPGALPTGNRDMVPVEKIAEGSAPTGTALNEAGYPIVGGYPLAMGGYPTIGAQGVAPTGGYFVAGYPGTYPVGGYGQAYGMYGGAPVGAAAAQAAQVGAEHVVAQEASTIQQAAHVAENAAVASQAYRHYPGGYGAYPSYTPYPAVSPCVYGQEALPYQTVSPYSGGHYPQTLYPTVAQSIYSGFPSYPYQQGISPPAWSTQSFFTPR